MELSITKQYTGMLRFLTIVSLLVTPSFQTGREDNKTDLYLLGLFSFNGAVWRGGETNLAAAEMAIKDINERPDLLPGYQLNVLSGDSQCDAGLAVDATYKMLYEEPTKIMILGPVCSASCQAVASATRNWHIVQMAYGCLMPSLSDKTLYPRFSRLLIPDTARNEARIALLQEFGWTQVATIHQAVDVYAETMIDLINLMEANGINVVSSDPIYDDPKLPLEKIKEMGTRIIIGFVNHEMSIKAFCEAYKLKLFGPKYGWLIQGWYLNTWIEDTWVDGLVDCTQEQIAEFIDGAFSVFSYTMHPAEDQPGVSGIVPVEFFDVFDEYMNYTADGMIGVQHAPLSYDTVWAISLALNATMTKLEVEGNKRLENYTYGDKEFADMIMESISGVAFDGISAKIKFQENGDVTTDFKVQQFQGGQKMHIGIYQSETQTMEFFPEVPIIWKGDGPPLAELTTNYVIPRVPVYLYSIMSALAITGIICSVVFLVLNIKLRHKRIIKMSSPNINNIILVGCILTYTSVLCSDMEDSKIKLEICWKLSLYTLLLGFSAAYGALFSKTWRVHMIFTSVKQQKKVVKDRQLLLLVLVFIGIDVITIAIWEGLDPVKAVVINLNQMPEEIGDQIYIYQIEACESRYITYWLAIIYSTKALMLVFGMFLAWETRKVSIPVLNDSRYIGMCIYNIVILSSVGAPVSYVLRSQPDIAYGLQSVFVLLGTTITQCLVILPKIMAYRAGEEIPMGTSSIRPTLSQSNATSRSQASYDRDAGPSKPNTSAGPNLHVTVGVQVNL